MDLWSNLIDFYFPTYFVHAVQNFLALNYFSGKHSLGLKASGW